VINLIVDHAGPLVPLKPSMIVTALLLVMPRLSYPLKTPYLVVLVPSVLSPWDATVVNHLVHGSGSPLTV
jgi:hypothetical protein